MKKYWNEDYQSFVYDECCYEDMDELVSTGMLGFCGCVGDEPTDKAKEVMKDLDRKDDNWVRWEELVAKHFDGDEAYGYFVLQYLDRRGLVEHGASIRSAWLTEKGKECLEAMEWREKNVGNTTAR